MERFEKLFRDAERLKPAAAMWRNIAARAGLPDARGRGGEGGGVGAGGEGGRGPGWRLAASLAIGLGVLSGLFMVMRGPGSLAGNRGAAGDSAVAAAVSGREAEDGGPVDPELLDWHADLGEESAMDWESDPLAADPAMEEADE